MATQSLDSSARRRKIALLLALLLACITIGIGGSMYYQQKKAKQAALAAASQENKTETPAAPEVIAGTELPSTDTPVLGSGPEEQAKPEEKTAPVVKRKPRVASTKKTDNIAEQLLASGPTAAGPQAPETPAVSLLDPTPGIVSPAPQGDAPSLLPDPVIDPPPGAGPGGDAPIANNVTPPAGTGGLTPGGNPITPVPEPTTWLMMLGGLGLLAAAARRRK